MWQIDHSREESVERDRSLEGVPTAALLVDRCEPEGADQERPQHRPTFTHVAGEEPPRQSARFARSPCSSAAGLV